VAECGFAVSFGGMESVQEFIAQLPKVELHVHLVGSASMETVLGLARRHPDGGVPLTAEGLAAFYEFRDFPHFIDVYDAVSRLVTEPEDVADLVRGVGRDLAPQNVRYVEMQVSPYAFRRAGLSPALITAALDAGARDALAEHGVRIAYIFDFPGQSADRHATQTLEHALEEPPEALIGFGIGGIEAARAPYRDVIRDVFAAAAAAGLRCVPHGRPAAGRVPARAAAAGRRVADLERAHPVRAVAGGAPAAGDARSRAVRDGEQ